MHRTCLPACVNVPVPVNVTDGCMREHFCELMPVCRACCPPDLLSLDKRLFETKRKDQLNALKNLVELNDINQQYKIIDIMLKGLFKVRCVCV